jgi:hypothetical protein
VPTERVSAVDLVVIVDDQIASRDRLDVTSTPITGEQDGCTGWSQAEWSADARRIYRQSEYTCSTGLTRKMRGLFGMTPGGDWLDVMSVATGDDTGARVLRYRPVPGVSSALSPDLRSALAQQMFDIDNARTAAAAPIAVGDVIEVSRKSDTIVVQAWLTELGQRFEITGRQLVTLADAGVSGRVTDLLVALAYPDVFSLRRSSSSGTSSSADDMESASAADIMLATNCRMHVALWASPLYGCGGYEILRHGDMLGPYGHGYGHYGFGGYGTYYSGGQPVVIVVGETPPHGQVVKGAGYVSGRSSDTSTPAPTPSSGDSSSSSSGSGSSGSSSSAPASDSGSSSGERTAHPR